MSKKPSWKAVARDMSRQLDDAINAKADLQARVERERAWIAWLDRLRATGMTDGDIQAAMQRIMDSAPPS